MNKFKDSTNNWLTKSLFRETFQGSCPTATPLYSLRCGKKEPCLHCLFMETNDPTGYTLAQEHLGGWPHLKRLRQGQWFEEFYKEWVEELEQKLFSEGVKKMRSLGLKGNSTAAKWLADKGWKEVEGPKRGRPSKAEVKGELRKQVALEKELEEFEKRVFN